MDFDKPKVYGDTSITDGLVCLRETSEKNLFPFFQLWTMARAAAEVKQVPLLGGWGSTWGHASPPHCGNTYIPQMDNTTHTPSSFSITIKIVMHPKKIETPHSFIADDDPLFDI